MSNVIMANLLLTCCTIKNEAEKVFNIHIIRDLNFLMLISWHES